MSCPLLELCKYYIIRDLFYIQLVLAVMAITLGVLLAWKPKKVIEIQSALYRTFNWKLEPISMEKEIRNVRIMGLTILILGLISLLYIIIQ